METFEELSGKAEASRLGQGQTPVVETVADAIVLARAVAQQLDGLSGDARLLMMSNLDDVRRALDGRMSRLQADMTEHKSRLNAVHRGLKAVDGYGGPRRGR